MNDTNAKKLTALLCSLALAASLYAQSAAGEAPVPGDTETVDRSYAYGLIIGADLQSLGLVFNYDAISQGIRDAVEGRDPRFTLDEAVTLVQQSYMAALQRQAEENRLKEIQFLEENGKRSGVITTASGLQYEVIHRAGQEKPNPQSVVRVNYEGTFTDGTVFDSSYDWGEPVDIPLSTVIPGWSEGVCLMGVGDIYTLYIPSRLGYGEDGAEVIAPYTPLIFKVELLAIVDENGD